MKKSLFSGALFTASLLVAVSSVGCSKPDPTKPVTPKEMGIGQPVLPGQKGFNKNYDTSKPVAPPTNGKTPG